MIFKKLFYPRNMEEQGKEMLQNKNQNNKTKHIPCLDRGRELILEYI